MKHFGSLRATLAQLEPAKLAALGLAGVALLVLLGWVASRSVEPMALLYSGLDTAEAGHISQRLDELKVPFETRGDGAIAVPASQVAHVRMELAASGLPHQAGAGYELLDAQSPMNMTSFMQRVQRLRALEGELGRTILTLDGVKSARVHIVLPERESFSRETPKPTASVAVILQGASRLPPRQAAAIRLLVAGAVPRLRQEDVSVLDPSGVVLAADGSDAMAISRLDELKRGQEQALQRATLELLEPLVGRGHVRAVVAVQIDATREVSREEKFDPLSQVERSRQTQLDQDSTDESKPRDPVSVGGNLPAPAQAAPAPAKSSSSNSRSGQTVNYELNAVRSERVREPGNVTRQTIAVVVDGSTDDKGVFHPRPKEELERIATLVRSAVGFDAKRGDVVTVDTMRFLPPEAPEKESSDGLAPLSPGLPWIPVGAVILLLCSTIAMLLRRRRPAPPAAVDLPQLAAAALAVTPPVPEERMLAAPDSAPPDALGALHDLLDARPDEALAVLRAWIAEGAPA